MKVKLAVALGLIAAIVLLVLLIALPGEAPVHAPRPRAQNLPQAPTSPAVTGAATPANTAAAPVPPPPQPLPAEDELAEMDMRIRGAADRLPAWQRFIWWCRTGRGSMPEAEYENARALYIRFLDKFAGITTAQFRVERYEIQPDGSQRLTSIREVYFSASQSAFKERIESTAYNEAGDTTEHISIWDGRQCLIWEQGKVDGRQNEYGGFGEGCLHRYEMSAIRESRPYFLNRYDHCEIDNGSAGYSRLWSEGGTETRFDTSTGLLTEISGGEPWHDTYKYQNIGGVWFPLEIVSSRPMGGPEGPKTENVRVVFSRVVLNEPVDESLFNVNNP